MVCLKNLEIGLKSILFDKPIKQNGFLMHLKISWIIHC